MRREVDVRALQAIADGSFSRVFLMRMFMIYFS